MTKSHIPLSLCNFLLIALICSAASLNGQELFPINEPASTMPKGVAAIRLTSHLHYKYQTIGHREMIRILYGAGAKVTVMLSTSASNFHVSAFPNDLNTYFNNYHNHKATENVYKHRFEGIHLYTRFRVVTRDEKNKHFRVALYGEISANKSIHLDAFPNPLGDNSGMGSGLILTKLNKRFAASFTGGYVRFAPYSATEKNESIVFRAAEAIHANISLGYLVYPRVYKSYRDLNVNLYLELNNKLYGDAVIARGGHYLNARQFSYLKDGSLSCINHGVQFIINSKTRCDLVFEYPLYYSNGLEKFPMLIINLQKYFF